jgi:hypothetical protein
MQLEQDPGGFERRRCAAAVLPGQIREAELGLAADLPEEIGVDFLGQRTGAIEEGVETGVLEAQEDVRRLDLGPLAVRRLDVERGVVLGEHGADFEGAGLFVQDVHRTRRDGPPGYPAFRPANSRISGRCSGKLFRVWSPPCTITCRAPAYFATASR